MKKNLFWILFCDVHALVEFLSALIHPADLRGLRRVQSFSAGQILLFPWKPPSCFHFYFASLRWFQSHIRLTADFLSGL
jgi:hypothetical protein